VGKGASTVHCARADVKTVCLPVVHCTDNSFQDASTHHFLVGVQPLQEELILGVMRNRGSSAEVSVSFEAGCHKANLVLPWMMVEDIGATSQLPTSLSLAMEYSGSPWLPIGAVRVVYSVFSNLVRYIGTI